MRSVNWTTWVKWTIWLLAGGILFVFFHYTLPQRDIVRIVNTEVRRVDFGDNALFWAGADSGSAGAANRDVRFIEAIRDDGRPIVYRNEDTGWGWPPYFKLDSSNLQARARDAISTREAPRWIAVAHYGWRNEWFSIFPNAIDVRQVAGPDVRLVPWANIVILGTLALLSLVLWRLARNFRRRRVDPLIADAGDAMEERRSRWRRRGRNPTSDDER